MADIYFWGVVFLAFFGLSFSATALYYSHQLYDEKTDSKDDLTMVDAMLGTMIGVFGLLVLVFIVRFAIYQKEASEAHTKLSSISGSR